MSLAAEYAGDPAFDALSSPALIGLIIERFHKGHRRDLADLLAFAQRVESVHAADPACPRGLSDLLAAVQAELEPHLWKEEEVLFPMMRAGGSPMIIGPITCMMQEHGEFMDQLDQLDRLANGCRPPAGACSTWQTLYQRLACFLAEAREHVRVENEVLFPRFAALSPLRA